MSSSKAFASMFHKHDAHSQVITPGNVCVNYSKKSGLRYCVYKEQVRNSTKGQYGKFITKEGIVTLKFTSVIFAFDPLSDERAKNKEISELIRSFYEEVR